MGMDAVEIVIGVEERFGVSISDPEATAYTTPGKLVDLVMAKLEPGGEGSCASRRAFHLLRGALTRTAPLARSEIKPGSRVPLPRAPREQAEFWIRLRDATGARNWPGLVRPRWMVRSIRLIFFGALAGALFVTKWPLALVIAVLAAALPTIATRRLRRCVPAEFTTVRSLVPFVESGPGIVWNRAEVARGVEEIVTAVIGLQPGEYAEHLDFIRDLRLD